jgi:hypothetical protein
MSNDSFRREAVDGVRLRRRQGLGGFQSFAITRADDRVVLRAAICPARVEREKAEPTAAVAADDAPCIINFGHRG